jgi:hypothetical protein
MTKIIETHTGIFNEDGVFIINTENKDFLGQCYLVFHNDKKNNISNLFEELIFSYNGFNSVISSDFLIILLYLNTEEIRKSILSKMLENTPIYFPLYLFFYNKPVYIKNQQVSFRLKKKKECTKIELDYDILTYEEPNFNDNKIAIEVFSQINTDIKEIINIKLSYDLQEMFWIYKNKDLYFHPVTEINLKIKTSDNNIKNFLFTPLRPEYYIHNQQIINHTTTNLNLYNYSFVLNPEYFDDKQFLNYKNAKCIILEQKIKDEFTSVLEGSKQIIYLKYICFVEIITDEIYQKLKKLKHLFYSLKFKKRFRDGLWIKVREHRIKSK